MAFGEAPAEQNLMAVRNPDKFVGVFLSSPRQGMIFAKHLLLQALADKPKINEPTSLIGPRSTA